ncbi:hypothetical protein M404DRAFT_1000115 [Pisolithus tinctorius Marx 270]|uniref:Uncharacterized protein n=1 Tax=Pisolithus tinctorius Marx 270 TaxID=870435 RepID=A0A0C3PAS7_PISTI|nr:hypothetical protein M404DRAFT_1000115 [Pisolithus tinctorius Marx 270]
MLGEYNQDALTASALDSGGKTPMKSLWREYEKQRWRRRGNAVCIYGRRTVFASQRATSPSVNGRSTEARALKIILLMFSWKTTWSHVNDYGMKSDRCPIRGSCNFLYQRVCHLAIGWSRPQREGEDLILVEVRGG